MKRINNFLIVVMFMLLFIIGCSGIKENEKCDGVNHLVSDWIVTVEATCTADGEKHKECLLCHDILETQVISKIGHNIVTDDEVLATCTESGLSEGTHCTRCEQILVEQKVLPSLGHNYILDEELSNNEYLVYKCTRCDETYQVKVSENVCKNGHNSSDWIVIKEATCTEAGSKHKVCLDCGIELEISTIIPTGHSIVIDKAVSATCTETGLSEGSHCSVCGEEIIAQTIIPLINHDYVLTSTVVATLNEEGYHEYTCSVCQKTYRVIIPKLSEYDAESPTAINLSDSKVLITNNNGGVIVEGTTITIITGGEYTLVGDMSECSIIVTISDEDKIVINLSGVNISSTTSNVIDIQSGDKVEISAKSGTKNYITDKRVTTDEASGAAIYSAIDMEIKGKGELIVVSSYNNGIASKDDIEIKNLTLNVEAPNNAIKGNDSLTITSGNITAISTNGDALKTENSDISDKGNQRGIITVEDGTLNLYAACDGIDASYDAIINGGIINIYTEAYSKYSKEVTVTSTNKTYLRISSRTSLTTSNKYSALFTLEDNSTIWVDGIYSPNGQTRYYEFATPNNSKYVKFYVYTSSQTLSQAANYAYASDQLSLSMVYDVYYVTSIYSSEINGSWTNYGTSQSGGGPWGGGPGMGDGNKDKATYSCKGIKADNEVKVSGGTITIEAHDDGIHANSDTLLETSSYGKGNVTISGGIITISSDDDGVHADGTLSISGGNVILNKSYEGYEGNYIYINGGTSQINASDDGVNAKTTLAISDGLLYLNASGDGLDSNGTVTMSGGIVLALGPTNGGNGVLDFDRSFSFSGGLLLAIGASGMNQKPSATSGNTSSSKSISTSTSSYVNVLVNNEIIAVIKVVKSNQNYCVLAYNNTLCPGATTTVVTSNSKTLVNNLYWVK